VTDAVQALGDSRIRCERSDEFLPVTKSWNRALNMAVGEYVTLIGDDDGLAPGFFQRIAELADRFENPDVVFSSLYQFFHPGVLPDRPLGMVQTLPTADFMKQRDYPFILDKASARRAVDSSLGLRRTFMFNMPALTVRRKFLDTLRREGEVLHPPFPDYYFANLVLDKASKIVVEPRPIALQGISTSSFGFTLFNQKTDEGFKVLGHKLKQDALFDEVGHFLLPGPGYNSQYIMTMAHLAKAIGDPSRQPDFKRYRMLQVYHHIAARGFSFSWGSSEEAQSLWRQISFAEKCEAYYIIGLHRFSKLFPQLSGKRDAVDKDMMMHAFAPIQYVLNEGDYIKNTDVFEALQDELLDPYRSHPVEVVQLTRGPFVHGIELTPGTRIVQRLQLSGRAVNSIAIQSFSFGKMPSAYVIGWKLSAVNGDDLHEIGEGKLSTNDYREWKKFHLKIPAVPADASTVEFEVFVPLNQSVSAPVLLPLFRSIESEGLSPAEVDGSVVEENFVLGLHMNYKRAIDLV
jgi:hypothetical protein